MLNMETTPRTGNLGNYPGPVKLWILRENLQPHITKSVQSLTTVSTFVLVSQGRCSSHPS